MTKMEGVIDTMIAYSWSFDGSRNDVSVLYQDCSNTIQVPEWCLCTHISVFGDTAGTKLEAATCRRLTRQVRLVDLVAAGPGTHAILGVFFMTDFSPMLILYTETRPSLASFLTGVCAIIGGIFTVASIIDGILYQASVKRKAAMGKAA